MTTCIKWLMGNTLPGLNTLSRVTLYAISDLIYFNESEFADSEVVY